MQVKYIGERDTVALNRDKAYMVLSAEKGWRRIMTELGEDYLFPTQLFEIVSDVSAISATVKVKKP